MNIKTNYHINGTCYPLTVITIFLAVCTIAFYPDIVDKGFQDAEFIHFIFNHFIQEYGNNIDFKTIKIKSQFGIKETALKIYSKVNVLYLYFYFGFYFVSYTNSIIHGLHKLNIQYYLI